MASQQGGVPRRQHRFQRDPVGRPQRRLLHLGRRLQHHRAGPQLVRDGLPVPGPRQLLDGGRLHHERRWHRRGRARLSLLRVRRLRGGHRPACVDCQCADHHRSVRRNAARRSDHVRRRQHDEPIGASANNQFTVRAAGGYRLFTNATATTGLRSAPAARPGTSSRTATPSTASSRSTSRTSCAAS